MRKTKKGLAVIVIILLLTAIAYLQALNKISIARTGGGTLQSGVAATEESKRFPITDAKDWTEKVDEEGAETIKSVWADKLENILPAEQIMDDGTIYIYWEDYRDIYSLFCSAHGTAMPGRNKTIVRSGGLEADTTDQGKKTAYLTVDDIDGATVFRNQTEWTDYTTSGPDNPFETTTSKTIGRYTNKGIKKATPAEAWVLAEMDKNVPGSSGDPEVEITNQQVTINPSDITDITEIDGEELYVTGEPGEEQYFKKDGDRYYKANVSYPSGGSGTTSYVQYAWWKVKTCGLPSTSPVEDLDGGLAAEAEAFEQYIIDVTGNSDVHNLERNADDTFKIDYKVSKTPDDPKEISVRFNSETNKYIVGPYTVSYLRACTQQAERAKVSFAGISNAILVGTDKDDNEVLDDDDNSVLQLGKNYRFVYDDEAAHKAKQEGFGDTDEDYPYPYSDEEFYIEMDYLEKVVYLKNLKFDFQYMTANGSYELFEGEYLNITWEPMSDVRSRLVTTSGGTASIVNNNTTVALNTEISSRLGSSSDVGTMQGTYTAETINGVSYFDTAFKSNYTVTGGTTAWSNNVLKATVNNPTRSNGVITVTGTVEDAGINGWVFANWMTHSISVNGTGVVANSPTFSDSTFSFQINIGTEKPYEKRTYTVSLQWGNATLDFSVDVYWYCSILSNDGKVKVASTSASKLSLDGNDIYYKGFLDKDAIELDFNPYKTNFAGYEKDYIYYVLGGNNCLSASNWTYGKFNISSNGNGSITIRTSANSTNTEKIELNYSVPDMCITSYGNTSESCEAIPSGTTFQLYNAFIAMDEDANEDDTLPDMITAMFNATAGTITIARSGIAGEDGNEEVILVDGCGSEVTINVSWKGEEIGNRNPTVVVGTVPVTPTRSIGYEYSYRYYMVASEASSATSQTQINACGDHEVIDVSAANGLGASVLAPVEIEFLHEKVDLRTSMAGMVWIDHDEQKDVANSGVLGIYDGNDELAKDNSVEVNVWKVKYDLSTGEIIDRNPAVAWDENENVIDFKNQGLFIKNGKYNVPHIQVPAEEGLDGTKFVMSYEVEFVYDGQTYEATEYLVPSSGQDKTTAEEKLEAFKKDASETAGADKDYTEYANSSYIVENADERAQFDGYFAEIYGDEPITEDGKTKGKATGGRFGYSTDEPGVMVPAVMKEMELEYESEVVSGAGGEKRKSNLITNDENGYVLEQYTFAARTTEAGLLLPYERQYHVKENYYDNLSFQGVQYKPIDEYFHQINLGLLERYHSDIGVKKDLYTANVVVNGNSNITKYNSLMPLTEEALNLQLKPEYRQHTYKIDLYNSDYAYRSGAYNSITDPITKTIVKAIKDGSELRLFVTYKLEFINESVYTDVSINEFVDYYDKSFTRIDQDVKMQIEDQTAQDEEPSRVEKTVAYAPYYRKLKTVGLPDAYHYNKAEDLNESLDENGNVKNTVASLDTASNGFATGSVKFEEPPEGVIELENYKMSWSTSLNGLNIDHTQNEDLTLEPGEVLEVFVTYEVDREGYNKAREEMEAKDETRKDNLLGEKNNIVEVSNYTTFYTEEACNRHTTTSYEAKQISGRVDQDSAPDNIDIEKIDSSNDTKMLEDDTEFAPCVTVEVREAEPRTLDGVVWEDSRQDYGVGDGVYNDGEKGIEGIDVTMVEKIRVTTEDLDRIKNYAQEVDPSVYNDLSNLDFLSHEFEYIWKTDSFDGFTNEITSGENGKYEFKNFVSGTYVVRFEYGNDVNETDLKYNGQDYKNATYQAALDGSTRLNPVRNDAEENIPIDTSDIIHLSGKATLNNEWHDLSANDNAKKLEEDRVSDARDYEPQRLRTIAYSRTIANNNAEVLASAIEQTEDVTSEKALDHVTEEYRDILKGNQKEFVENTRMVANTAKLFIDIEKQDTIAYKRVITEDGEEIVKTTEAKDNPDDKHEYYIKNIDFGLVERPETRINIRKEISAIQLLKNDGKELILGVKFDENGNLIKDSEKGNGSVRLEKISEINKESLGDGQGFKYIAMEAKMLNGLQVKLTYRIEVINNSELDYVSATLDSRKQMQFIYDLIDRFENTEEERLYNEEGLQGTVPFNAGKAIIYGRYLGTYYYTNKYIDNVNEINNLYAATEADGQVNPKYESEVVVKTTVDQLVDYIDNDLSISMNETNYENSAWVGSSEADRQHKLSEVSYEKAEDGTYEKVVTALQDDKQRAYVTKNNGDSGDVVNNNIYMSTNDVMIAEPMIITYGVAELEDDKQPKMELDSASGTLIPVVGERAYEAYTSIGQTNERDNSNNVLTTELVPEVYKNANPDTQYVSTGEIDITTSAQASEESINNMNYDNLVEIAMYSNSAGRRDMQTIPGNANMIAKDNRAYMAGYIKAYNATTNEYEFKTQKVEYKKADGAIGTVNTERDAYAARDTVTFSEPTGLSLARQKANKTIRILLVSLIIAAIAIVAAIVVTAIRKNNYDDNDILKNRN